MLTYRIEKQNFIACLYTLHKSAQTDDEHGRVSVAEHRWAQRKTKNLRRTPIESLDLNTMLRTSARREQCVRKKNG